jgi:thiol-disulfide isomerase/thioredoxin
MAGGRSASIAFQAVTVNKRLLFASLALATAVVVVVAVAVASRPDSGNLDDATLTSSNDLSPSIGTNAAVTGHTVAQVNVQTVDGDAYPTSELKGRPVVINLWYSTCAPCKRELPAFAAAQRMFGDTVRFVGINSSGLEASSEEKFARDHGVQYELFYDPNGEFTSAMRITNFPQTLLVNGNGTIVDQTGELTADQLEQLIRTKLL